jgi:1,4-alpha-glucan branching enzyme
MTPPTAAFALHTARAIAEGTHGDPFAVLGLHPVGTSWQVRAFVPGAEALTVLAGSNIPAIPYKGVAGMFTADLPGHCAYRLEARGHGTTWVFDDPFRFGPVLGEMDEYLLGEGTHKRLWQVLGAHPITHEGVEGVHFAVWAPNAQRAAVVGDFNLWDGRRAPMRKRGPSGVWEIFIPGLTEGTVYKYELRGPDGGLLPLRSDPVGFGSEHAPANASVVRDIGNPAWQDGEWMARRGAAQNVDAPISVYEVHLASWRRAPGDRMLSYTELADQLIAYVTDMGFTHIELMPISEYPFDGSWGYQPVGLFAPTIRHGTPPEFRALMEAAHVAGIGVLLDWVPGHFPSDAHGLARFDGTPLYEHADPREGFHQDWNTLIFNYGRVEVANYLISNALYWLEEYHLDGLRVDAVASMLYRDYSREAGQWIPNRDGGRENYEAIALLQNMNITAYGDCPGVMTVAEESTAFPGVSRPVNHGGLGFGFKWNMGWMNDTLSYMQSDPIYRKHHHHQMTFGLQYAWSENFILPISHDEVVHGKGSMLGKMPGERDQKFANLRAFYGFMWGHPGKKLLFQGCEWGQNGEWAYDRSLDWHELEDPAHRGVQRLVRDLNHLYCSTAALHLNDTRSQGFDWISAEDAEGSTYAFVRRGGAGDALVLVVSNFTPVERQMRLGLPAPGHWAEVLNTDAQAYGGGNRGNFGGVATDPEPSHNQAQSAMITLPPLSTVFFQQTNL